MSQIKVSLYDQTAVFTETPDIFSGDIDVDTVKFTFDDSWNVYNKKTAIFYNDPKKSYPVFLDDTNTAVIPSAVIDRETKLYFGVIGTNANNEVKTSSILSYRIERGAISADVEIPPSSAEIWLQILLNYEIALKKLQDMSNNLENMNNTLEELDQRFIDAGVENKANINLNNLTDDATNVLLSRINMDNIPDGETYRKIQICTGLISGLPEGGSIESRVITFPKAFTAVPTVLCTPESGQDNYMPASTIKPNTVSKTGFTVKSLASSKVHWVAILIGG